MYSRKIAFITDYSGIGGGETSLLNTVKHFGSQSTVAPRLVVLNQGKLQDIASDSYVNCCYLKISRFKRAWVKDIPLISPVGVYRAIRFIRKHQFESIVINSSERALVYFSIASYITGVPCHWICHGQWERPFGRRRKWLNHFLDSVLFVSDFVKSYSEFDEGKSHILHLAVPAITPIRTSKSSGSNKKTRIALIGRFQEVKRQDLLIDAVDRLRDLGVDLECNFYGDTQFSSNYDEYKNYVMNKIEASKHNEVYRLHGHLDKVATAYIDNDIIVVPSEFESFSMVTLEALSYGKTVVATDLGGPSEILDNGRFGYLFKSGDLNDLVEKIKLAISKPMSEELLKKRADKFSLSSYCNKLYEIIK